MGQHEILDAFDALPQLFQHQEIVVHHEIEDRVGQVVRALPARRAQAFPDAPSEGIEEVTGPFLEGDDVVPAEHEGELFVLQAVGFWIPGEHLQHHVEVLAVVLEFRALVGREDVLLHERVELQHLAEHRDRAWFACLVDIDPAHAAGLLEGEAILDTLDLALAHLVLVEVDHAHPCALGAFLADVDERAGR
jgi:hypothetical protein